MLGVLIGLMVLVALVGAAVGLVLGTAAPIQLLPLIFALVLTPLIFTGCTFYPWASLGCCKWYTHGEKQMPFVVIILEG